MLTADERLTRLDALARKVAQRVENHAEASARFAELRVEAAAIIAQSPDPDVLQARKLVIQCVKEFASNSAEDALIAMYEQGKGDDEPEVAGIVAALRAAREQSA